MRERLVKRDNSGGYDRIRLIYILAASHSGSTLLAMLLNSHPDICTVGELKVTSLGDLDRYRCSCQQLITKCPFWNGIRQDMKARGIDFDITDAGTDIRTGMSPYVHWLLRPLHRGPALEMLRDVALNISPSWRQNFPKILVRNQALIECVARRSDKRIIIDSSKIGLRLKYLLRIPELDISVIRLIRDGRGVALTYMDPARFADAQDPSLRGGGIGGDRSNERLSLKDAAHEWRRSNEEAEAVVSNLPTAQWISIRYEDLCAQPQTFLQLLVDFIGVRSTACSVNFRTSEHHVIGNGMRLDNTSEIQPDERWKSHLTPEQLHEFEMVAGKMNRRLGYI